MCGRYVASTPPEVLADYFRVDEVRARPAGPSWNVAPTDPVPAVAERAGVRQLGVFRWGLIPSWSADGRGAASRINARAETVCDKASFRTAVARRRCLLPASGFYEWERDLARIKRPWYVHRADGAPMAFAGLWDAWRSPGGELVRTCTIVTTVANTLMAPVHDRMPVVLERDTWDVWLDRSNDDLEELRTLLVPAATSVLQRYPVGQAVNSVRNNGPELVVADGSVSDT